MGSRRKVKGHINSQDRGIKELLQQDKYCTVNTEPSQNLPLLNITHKIHVDMYFYAY